MALSEEKVTEILQVLANEVKLGIEIKAVVHREETLDYVAVIGKVHYSEIREKLLSDYVQTKNRDTRNEIIFKLKHPLELEEWQKEDFGLLDENQGAAADEKTVVDDSQKNDWV